MFVSLLLFLSLVQGLLANYLDLHVHHLRVAEDNGLDRTEINFRFEDPNTNGTAACGAQFPNNGTNNAPWFPDHYIACGTDPYFAWKIEEYQGAAAFQLDLRRSFKDPRYVFFPSSSSFPFFLFLFFYLPLLPFLMPCLPFCAPAKLTIFSTRLKKKTESVNRPRTLSRCLPTKTLPRATTTAASSTIEGISAATRRAASSLSCSWTVSLRRSKEKEKKRLERACALILFFPFFSFLLFRKSALTPSRPLSHHSSMKS